MPKRIMHDLKKYKALMRLTAIALLVFGAIACSRHLEPQIEIISYLLRDRVIPIDPVTVRSVMIVGFKLSPRIEPSSNMVVKGELYFNRQLISNDEVPYPDPNGGNLGFNFSPFGESRDLNKPLIHPDGVYLCAIRLMDETGAVIAAVEKDIKSSQVSRRFDGFGETYPRTEYVEVPAIAFQYDNALEPDCTSDYIVFQKNYLERVYPGTVPNPDETVSAIKIEASVDEYRPVTFSIRAQKNLGRVYISVSELAGPSGSLGQDCLKVGGVGQLTEKVGEQGQKDRVAYRWAPKVIESHEVSVEKGLCQRYWLTLKVPPDAVPGDYRGTVSIMPESARSMEVPLTVTVLPFRLADTDIDYGMMMTYAFYELDDNEWTPTERTAIRDSGFALYRDLRAHGMTMIFPHSHFYLQKDENGDPVLKSLEAGLEAYAALGFPGPFCWYLGHLVQTSKIFHPGSILNYDEQLSEFRLRSLLETYAQMAGRYKIPGEKLIVQTVDEPDRRDRIAAGKALDRIAREKGFKTLITRKWPEADIVCTQAPKGDQEAKEIRDIAKTWWIYPNDALTSNNSAYTRYVFGFGAWRWDVDGVVPWTFQMTQGCNGSPFTVPDGDEVMVAYPGGSSGPLSTPLWETIRDGINDYKYIFQLKALIATGKKNGEPKAFEIERQLNQLRKTLGEDPSPREGVYGDWPCDSFDKMRKQIVEWMLELKSAEAIGHGQEAIGYGR